MACHSSEASRGGRSIALDDALRMLSPRRRYHVNVSGVEHTVWPSIHIKSLALIVDMLDARAAR